MVESLMYLMIGSYLDIGFAVVKLTQQMANLSNEQDWAGLHFCRYLLNTCKDQIVYDRLSNESVVASDLDWVQDLESCKSMTGYFTLMAYEVTSWMSIEVQAVLTHFFIPTSLSLLIYSSFYILSFYTSVIFIVSIVISNLSSLSCE